MTDISSTNGNRGRAFDILCNTRLFLYEAAGFDSIGEQIEEIDLQTAKFIKGSCFVLHTTMKLQYNGFTYSFQGFTQAAKFIDTVKGCCNA